MKKFEIIRPGEPGYDELPTTDATGAKAMSLASHLRLVKEDLHHYETLEKQGQEYTLPELPQGKNHKPEEAHPIKDEIARLKKIKAEIEEVIAWTEAKEPGLSKKPGSGLSMYDFLKEQAAKNGMLGTVTEQQKLDFVRSLTVNFTSIDQNLNYVDSLNAFYRNDMYDDPYMAIVEIAYTTLRRRNGGISNHPAKDKIYNEAKPFLREEIMHLDAKTKEEFDEWHRKTTEKLIDIFAKNGYNNFNVGKAQKWINMSLKHLSIFNPLMTISCYSYLHVPIDSIVLKGLKTPIAPAALKDIDCSFDQAPKKIASWSKIGNYDSYMKFQEEIRAKCGEIPLDFEFWFWPKSNEYLRSK